MNPTFAKMLFVGVPLIVSLAWFVFWVVKLTRTARKLRKRPGEPGSEPPRT
ncbi:MAG TPA: hypothetical protein VMV03_07730 [Spirochaetia bacterium]|nr:hypothetical protein [Spirochaetia bacterium]